MVKKLTYYVGANGKQPFIDWFERLDIRTQVIVMRYRNGKVIMESLCQEEINHLMNILLAK